MRKAPVICSKSTWHDRTFNGLILRRYRDMRARINGAPQYKNKWVGLDLLTREEFVKWAKDCGTYETLWKAWVQSEYKTGLAPSIDRIDSCCGYVTGNMQWLTRSEHNKKSANARIRRI